MCCGYLTLTDDDPNSYEICPVCYWENDRYQNENPDDDVGANPVSLNTARANYQSFGAKSEKAREHVRQPLPHESPPSS